MYNVNKISGCGVEKIAETRKAVPPVWVCEHRSPIAGSSVRPSRINPWPGATSPPRSCGLPSPAPGHLFKGDTMIIKQSKKDNKDGSNSITVIIKDGDNQIEFVCKSETAAQSMIRDMIWVIRKNAVEEIKYQPSYE